MSNHGTFSKREKLAEFFKYSMFIDPWGLILYALFGCAEMIFGIELRGNSKSGVERKWLTI
jgi:hypothetical protein